MKNTWLPHRLTLLQCHMAFFFFKAKSWSIRLQYKKNNGKGSWWSNPHAKQNCIITLYSTVQIFIFYKSITQWLTQGVYLRESSPGIRASALSSPQHIARCPLTPYARGASPVMGRTNNHGFYAASQFLLPFNRGRERDLSTPTSPFLSIKIFLLFWAQRKLAK